MPILEDSHYEESRKALMQDPIVQDMARGLEGHPIEELAHESGTPRHEFMLAANREYHERGGLAPGHLGAVAEALLRLRKGEGDG
jgi:hypothetical protein